MVHGRLGWEGGGVIEIHSICTETQRRERGRFLGGEDPLPQNEMLASDGDKR
jgi:hypothetical protein